MTRAASPKIDPALASRLREAILRQRLVLKDTAEKFVADLTNAINTRHHDDAYVSERTVWRYLSSEELLAQKAALDLIAVCRRLRPNLPYDLVDEIYLKAVAPQAIIFTRESSHLADAMVTQARHVVPLSPAAARRLKKRFVDFLAPYENFNRIELGRTVWFWIISYFGGERKWKVPFNQLRMGVDASPDGRSYKVPWALDEAIEGMRAKKLQPSRKKRQK